MLQKKKNSLQILNSLKENSLSLRNIIESVEYLNKRKFPSKMNIGK